MQAAAFDYAERACTNAIITLNKLKCLKQTPDI